MYKFFKNSSNNLRPGERGVSSCLRANRHPIGFGALVLGNALYIVPLVAFSRYKDASSFVARSLLFRFSSYIGYSSRSCSDLRLLVIDYCRSLIAMLRFRIRSWHLRSRVIINLRSLNKSSFALLEHCLFLSKSSSK